METTVCDCGHANDWSADFGCRDNEGKSKCRTCAHTVEVEALKTANHAFAYLNENTWTITDWAGLELAKVGTVKRHTKVWSFQAVDVHGQRWTCRHWPSGIRALHSAHGFARGLQT